MVLNKTTLTIIVVMKRTINQITNLVVQVEICLSGLNSKLIILTVKVRMALTCNANATLSALPSKLNLIV